MPRMKDTWQLALFNDCLSHFSGSHKITHILLPEYDYSAFAAMYICEGAGAQTASALSKHMVMTITTNLLSPELLDAFGAPFAIWCQGRLGA